MKQTEVDDASGKHTRVRRRLNAWYYGAESTSNSMVIGSYGKNTEIRPPSDVDILFELPWSVFTRLAARTGNVQSQLLQEVKSVLGQSFPTTRMRADGQVVIVPFATYAIEVLPAFQLVSGQYWYPDTNGGGNWKTADPIAEKKKIVDSNSATGGKTTHLIKLIKAWKNARNVKIKSFVLELAAVEFIGSWIHNRTAEGALTSYSYYDFMVRDFFSYLVKKGNGFVFSAGTFEAVALGDEWSYQASVASNAASRATALGADDKTYASQEEWKKIFGYYV